MGEERKKIHNFRMYNQPAVALMSFIYQSPCYNALFVPIIALEANTESLYLISTSEGLCNRVAGSSS